MARYRFPQLESVVSKLAGDERKRPEATAFTVVECHSLNELRCEPRIPWFHTGLNARSPMSSATASMSSSNSCVTHPNRRSPPDAYARSTAGSLGPNHVPWCRDPFRTLATVQRHLVGCCRRLKSTFDVPGPCTRLSDVERAGSQERGTATPKPPQVWWPPTQTSARRCNTLRETSGARNLPQTCQCMTWARSGRISWHGRARGPRGYSHPPHF
jgi:hypothetical protein